MSESSLLPRKILLSLSVGQGFALYLLYRAADTKSWPSEDPLWSYPLWTLVVAVPILLLLSLEKGNLRAVLKQVGLLAAILTALAVYIGWQAEPFGLFRLYQLSTIYALTTALACFKALMYIQQRASGQAMTYDVLFIYSWRNFLVAALSALFVLAFWLILMLWAQLFKSIGIDFFRDLFKEEWFAFPVLGFAAGLAVIIFRNLVNVIESITRLLQGLIKLLLPLVLVVAAIFLISLPFVGLDALWSTGNGTALLLWLLAITLFFTNAVYQDGRGDSPYPIIVHRAIYGAMMLLPVVSVLSFYGLWLRLDQYGWTVARGWAFVVWLVLSLFAFGYVWGIVRMRDQWTQDLARVNTGMGLVVLAMMLVSNSPLLDFRKIAISSQLARVESGEVELKNFDFWYARQSLARPGYLAVEEIRAEIGDSDPSLLKLIDEPVRQRNAEKLIDTEEFWSRIVYRPEVFDVDDELRRYMYATFRTNRSTTGLYLIRTELDDSKGFEYVLVSRIGTYINRSIIFYRDGESWAHTEARVQPNYYRQDSDSNEFLSGEINVEQQRFKQLRIGGVVIEPMLNTKSADALGNESITEK